MINMVLTDRQKAGLLSPPKTDDWGTPQKLFDDLHAEFGFNLDVAASDHNAKCDRYFTIAENGLDQIWSGVCWMNPPYGRGIEKWIRKASESDALVVGLLPARTDTRWFHDYCLGREIRFIKGRLYFNDGDGRCPFPSMIVIFK